MAVVSSVWDTSSGSGVTAAQAEKLALIVHGTQTISLDMEMGTFDTDAATSSNREVRARSWHATNDSEGRFFLRPLPGYTGGDLIIRLWTSLGVSGSAGNEVAWHFACGPYALGETLAASLPNDLTVYQDVSAQTAHVLTAFDITIPAAQYDHTKRFAIFLERLANSDARDDYTGGTFYTHDIECVYTGWGMTASPSAPA